MKQISPTKIFRTTLPGFLRQSLLCLIMFCFAFDAQTIYIENKTGQKVRMQIISQEGDEFIKDWNTGESFNYTYQPLLISIYGYETPACTKFCSRGSGPFDTISFSNQGKCFIGTYKTAGRNQGQVFRKNCHRNAWEPLMQMIFILTPEQEQEFSLLQKASGVQTQKRRPPISSQQQIHGRAQSGKRQSDGSSAVHKQEGLHIINKTNQGLKLRIYTSNCEEIFHDLAHGAIYNLEPGKHIINLTVYPKAGQKGPCMSFPRIGMDASFNTLTISGQDKNMVIAYSQPTAQGATPNQTVISQDPNYSRDYGWDTNKNAIYSSTAISANYPPASLMPDSN